MTDSQPEKLEAPSGSQLERLADLQALVEKYRAAESQTWKKVSTILSSIPLGLAVVDTDGKIEATNAQLRQLFEYEAADLYGQPIQVLFPELDGLPSDNSPGKISGRIKSGEKLFAEVTVNMIETSSGTRHCVHVKDISEKQRMLEYKMNLASMVSHDLRTPLTTMRAVLSSIEAGEYGELSSDGGEAVKWAILSSNFMESMVANILDAERIDTSELVLNRSDTSTGKIVREAVELSKLYANELGIKLETDFSNDTFYADEARLVRILVNLLANAVKFSPPGAVVRVEAGLAGLDVRFRVTDRGPGIPEDLHEIIFDRFQHIHKSGRDNKAGFGLGLSISKVFAELHDGVITVRSKPGEGSTFQLSIPFRESR